MSRLMSILALGALVLTTLALPAAAADPVVPAGCHLVEAVYPNGRPYLKLVCDVTGKTPGVPGTPVPPVKVCDGWKLLTLQDAAAAAIPGAAAAPQTRPGPGGTTETLYYRNCADGTVETRWLRPVTPRDLADQAFGDLKDAGFPSPSPSFSPPIDKMFVNIDTWVAVEPLQPLTVRADAGGLWAMATATPVKMVLHTGTTVRGDTQTVECVPWGSTLGPECAWTPTYPSVEKVTGTTDYRYHGSIVIVWAVTWTSSSGQGGNLGQVSSSTPLLMGVREIQTL